MRRVVGSGLVVALMVTVGCSGESVPVPQTAAAAEAADIPEVLATVGGEDITLDDIRPQVGAELDQIETRYQLERSAAIQGALEGLLRNRILGAEAERQGTNVQTLIVREAGGSLTPTDVEIQTWYNENQARLSGRSLDQVRTQIVQFLEAENRERAVASLHDRLSDEQGVEVFFEKYRLAFNDAEAPSRGPEDAPVTLVEFSDFECPFCGRFFPVLKQVEAEYGDQVRIIYRQFPLTNLHPNAFKAAEASLCANEQESFWNMHDLMFQEQTRLTVSDLKEKAGRLGLDQGEFDQCLDTGRFVQQVQEDFREGQRVGVTGTPAIFINGVRLEGGAVAFDVVADAIDAELNALDR